MINPFPKQIEVVDQMLANLTERGYTVVLAGQRSGKTAMCYQLAARAKYPMVIMLGMGQIRQPLAAHGVPDSVRVEYAAHYAMHEPVGSVLVIMHEPFLVKSDAAQTFSELREHGCHVAAIGSLGPEYEAADLWKTLIAYRYATWDINPNLTQDSDLIRTAYENDPTKAARDFGSVLPR